MEVPHNTGRILTINGGSSTIKFAVFSQDGPRRRLLTGLLERIGKPDAFLTVHESGREHEHVRSISASDHAAASGQLIEWLRGWLEGDSFAAVGHRVVHGGSRIQQHRIVTPELVEELERNQPLDLAHLPREISLIRAFRAGFPDSLQVACFDTAFFASLPRVAQLLPIPRRYWDQGVRRLGFHGLSYTYLMRELRRVAGDAAKGRVILAHLGSGASLTAVCNGVPLDTSMAFTPTAGLMMATRPGDLDPGLLVYMMRVEKLDAGQMDMLISRECGLGGVSGGMSDVRDLLAMRDSDPRAADALDLFCYQAKKWVGAYAAALGGLDTIVFSGGIGEHSPEVRAAICAGLEFLGIRIEPTRNESGASIISDDDSPVTVRVIATDEESVVAEVVSEFLIRSQQ